MVILCGSDRQTLNSYYCNIIQQIKKMWPLMLIYNVLNKIVLLGRNLG